MSIQQKTTPTSERPVRLRLTALERKASMLLALLFASRMLGLFLLTPVFAVVAQTLVGGDDLAKVGLALGAYGLTQAVLQIPLGMASDKFGRRPVIVGGMLLFVAGGVVCALATSIEWVTVGRCIQGLGAVSAAISAWVADSTRPEVRTRAMAMVGGSIGISFAVSLVLSPLLVGQFGLSGLFWVISLLGFVCLLIAAFVVPNAPISRAPINQVPASAVLRHADLLRLNLGVFCLHFVLMSLFIVVPGSLARLGNFDSASLWQVYLPVILVSFLLMVPAVFYTETRKRHKQALELAVLLLVVVLALMPWVGTTLPGMIGMLILFFIAFNILEALQPSLVSRVAPAEYKGMALGFYNTTQSLGVFSGGLIGGLLLRSGHGSAILWLGSGLSLLWLLTALGFKDKY
ncbi:MFS transporter [Alcaligenes endophyticus]|uniref:MFS transporter n=1 Tax=Alcaligenes endophyticus TaxID=1929088 RepID=A0ABT8EEM5_9BURK|nr:MFS transporter [Alcaligenes endophyticus]MCX5592303.1 MFS transporter [Alcaligenes endophyticus]MDN4119745.1 MFS transporter [Alcaligenes endophyticus]